ncbi:hypothetical protein [Mycolicibacter longobardus]|uniref:Secreted protein n=1 Tax=Mycolicibacter longobardus TaxID=1108812 RepID=A0A1X1YFY8_9MYCO|nr:hypothetical protein [Mycolicibacter longobardus]MCV7384730.1 hypothetical protein [Mycolicibacter longobardus]ORW09935.1 hypothetical protein AWC16_15575 [Mycolicibacter longobardus]
MIRELAAAAFIAAAAGAAAVTGAPAAGAYPGDVPGMVDGQRQGDACFSWERFIYGHGPNGQALACHFIANQWPPKDTGFWQISYPLYGVQEIGSPCPNPQSAAQSPDGLPLLCLGARGWQPGIYTGGIGPYFPPGIAQVG